MAINDLQRQQHPQMQYLRWDTMQIYDLKREKQQIWKFQSYKICNMIVSYEGTNRAAVCFDLSSSSAVRETFLKDSFVDGAGDGINDFGGSESTQFVDFDAAIDGVETTNWAGVVMVFQEIPVDDFPVRLVMGVLEENEESSVFDIYFFARLLCLACDRVSEPDT